MDEPCAICRDGDEGICTMHNLAITRRALRWAGQDIPDSNSDSTNECPQCHGHNGEGRNVEGPNGAVTLPCAECGAGTNINSQIGNEDGS